MQQDTDGLAAKDAMIGMLAMTRPDKAFTQQMLRDFLQKESEQHPFLCPLFRTRKTECGDAADGFDDTLFFVYGTILSAAPGRDAVRVKPFVRNQVLEGLREKGILPKHETLIRGLATRFCQFLDGEPHVHA